MHPMYRNPCRECGEELSDRAECEMDGVVHDPDNGPDEGPSFEAALWAKTAPPVRDTLTGMAGR